MQTNNQIDRWFRTAVAFGGLAIALVLVIGLALPVAASPDVQTMLPRRPRTRWMGGVHAGAVGGVRKR